MAIDESRGRESRSVSTLVISESTFLRGGMRALLTGSRYEVRHETHTIAEAMRLPGVDASLVLVGGSLTDDTVDALKSLRAVFVDSRIVFYAQTLQLSPGQFLALVSFCLNGCLTADMSAPVLLRYIDLIMSGQTVFRPRLLIGEGWLGEDSDGLAERFFSTGHGLSERERQILRCLNQGRPNKHIAHQLNLSEATVKTHIRTLLRKIGASNRTQAAIWAARNNANWSGELPPFAGSPAAV